MWWPRLDHNHIAGQDTGRIRSAYTAVSLLAFVLLDNPDHGSMLTPSICLAPEHHASFIVRWVAENIMQLYSKPVEMANM